MLRAATIAPVVTPLVCKNDRRLICLLIVRSVCERIAALARPRMQLNTLFSEHHYIVLRQFGKLK
jgi:hypothetical protein